RRDGLEQRAGPVQQERARGARRLVPREPLEELRLAGRADPGHVTQPPVRCRRPKLRRGTDPERAPDLDGALRREPEETAEPDELRVDLALELVELRDRAGLHELP